MVCPLSLNDFIIGVKVVNDAVDSIFALERIFGVLKTRLCGMMLHFIEV